jgi:hypothetical protein
MPARRGALEGLLLDGVTVQDILSTMMSKRIDFVKEGRAQARSFSRAVRDLVATELISKYV